MTNQSFNSGYKIANISKDEEKAIQKVEKELKDMTKKDFIVIAWERK